MGRPRVPRHKRLTQNQRFAIVRKRAEGVPIEDLAREFGRVLLTEISSVILGSPCQAEGAFDDQERVSSLEIEQNNSGQS